jgi:F0F1-type ATP synthase membrane subunit c/vacuolar-type H+-ATPase subunit K
MVDVSEAGATEKRLLTLWIIWAGIFVSLFVYALICHLWGDGIRGNAMPNFPLDLMRNVLYGVAIFTLILTHFLRKFMLTIRSGGSVPTSLRPQSDLTQSSLISRYATSMIISLALSESIGLYGFVLFLLGDNFRTLYIFVGISAIALFFYRPKREEIETLALRESGSAPNMGGMKSA